MNKERKSNRENKKPPQKTLKERRLARKEKNESKKLLFDL
jgi:hypothetical protein